jgi:cobalt-zinc-cadmium efflux system protein
MHSHSHDHGHDHSHHAPLTNVNAAFIIGISMNFVFVIAEVITGLYIHSVSLLSDAGHNLADVAGLGLSLLAFRLLKVKPTKKYTYGYRKTSILVALLNSILLLVSIGAIAYGAVEHFIYPQPLPGMTIAIVAGGGIFINTISALMFLRDKDKDMNIKSAYLHLMFDALVSLGLVIGGIIIYYTHWYWLDSVLSLAIVLIIITGTWNLLKESLRLSLDGVPEDIDIEALKIIALKIPGVKDLHHIHVWAISTTQNALTAHLVLEDEVSPAEESRIKHQLKHDFEHSNIQHSTLETEKEVNHCHAIICK